MSNKGYNKLIQIRTSINKTILQPPQTTVMKNVTSLLRILQKNLFLLFAILATLSLEAQVKTGFEHKSNCLQSSFSSFGIDSACESVAWFVGNSTTPVSKQDHFNYTFSKAGSYTICMSVYNICKRYDTLYCKTITVSDCNYCDSIETKLKISKDTSTCGKYRFDAYPKSSNSLKVSYSWTFGEGSTSDNDDPSLTYTRNGTYNPCVKITAEKNGKTCVKTLCETIKVECSNNKPKCSWKEQNIFFNNQCNTWVFNAPFYEDSCVEYNWTINGKTYSKRIVTVVFDTKDSFEVCLKLKSLCTQCDTQVCTVVYNNCLTSTKKCEWGNVGIGHSIKNDLCGKVIFEATAQKDTCISTEYYFDGKWYSGRIFDHQFKANGRYKYGFRYKNNCTGCDTSIYKWVEIGCFNDSTKNCNWSRLKMAYHGTSGSSEDDCRKYVFQVQGYEDSCNIYKMKVVHQNTAIYQETGKTHNYKFEKDGYYNVCFWAKNECLNCDTWICETVYINCNSAQTQSFENIQVAPAPNPVNDILKLNNVVPLRVEIQNVLGKVFWSNAVGINAEIDMSSLPNQTYVFYAIDDQGNRYMHKLIKN